uniref:Uncharacterized protein n=1 Tax=Arundo donax TaxID=35708 RepID=A0A0A9HDN3_ARUDO
MLVTCASAHMFCKEAIVRGPSLHYVLNSSDNFLYILSTKIALPF